MADEYTLADAEAAGWRVVHEGVDPNDEDATANATMHRAEKYHSPAGRPGVYIEEFGETADRLLARIEGRERHLASVADPQGTVTVPAEGAEEVDASDESTIERVGDDEITAAARNDVLTVLSDPGDPESEPVQKVIVAGNEVDVSELSEPTAPSTGAEADTRDANQAGIDSALRSRDEAESASDADGPDASAAAAQARFEAQSGDEGDSGNDPEKTQPAAGEATDASDSEQQSQVPDADAASSDAVGTNDPRDQLATNLSQPEESGPDTDSEAPADAPNAGQAAPTDAAVALASERGVDLSEVDGSGKDGRVTKGDVEAFLDHDE